MLLLFHVLQWQHCRCQTQGNAPTKLLFGLNHGKKQSWKLSYPLYHWDFIKIQFVLDPWPLPTAEGSLWQSQSGWHWCPWAPTACTASDGASQSKLIITNISEMDEALYRSDIFQTPQTICSWVIKDQICHLVPRRNINFLCSLHTMGWTPFQQVQLYFHIQGAAFASGAALWMQIHKTVSKVHVFWKRKGKYFG